MKELFNGLFNRKKVLITGHTGFKGSWLSMLLHQLGTEVYGYALTPPTTPNLYNEAHLDDIVKSTVGDIRDFKKLKFTIEQVRPEIIIHMAAQPLVRVSYKDPIETYSTNVMGTVNLFEAIRQTSGVKVVINVTTDKCYENREWHWGYRENEPMGGYDPYSNSKGCSELVTSSFRNSYFSAAEFDKHGVALASARAGNVIGGGDWAPDRLIPDFIRSISKGEKLCIRSPHAIRPWQNVLEPLSGYLALASKLLTDGPSFAQAYNFGPDDADAKSVEWISKTLCKLWGEGADYSIDSNPQPHEANYLKLDCSKAKAELGWFPKWDIETTLKSIVDWSKSFIAGDNIREVTEKQIYQYFDKE